MTFSDSDWTREPPRRPRVAPGQRRIATLAALIALGCVAIALTLFGVEQWLDARARGEVKRNGSAASAAQASAPLAPAAALPVPVIGAVVAPASSAAAARDEAALDRQQMAALEAEMKQRAREAAEQAVVDAARRKERAWERWYQRPAFCNDNPTAAQMVQCANQYIRARKEFEDRYAAGRLYPPP